MKLDELRQVSSEFGNIEFLAKQVVEGFITGLHKSPYHGFSVEFAEHRQYNAGESTRHIDWKVYAKTDKVFVKRYEEETNLRCTLLLDISSSMYYPLENYGKLRFSVMAAASIAYMLQRQRDAVGLITFSDKINYKSQIKSTASHLNDIFKELSVLMVSKPELSKTSIHSVIHEIAETLHRRSLLIIFSDMFSSTENTDELFDALKHLKHNNHEVLIFHIKDKSTEDDFNFAERPMMFVDVETGEKIKLNPGQLKETYQNSLAAFNKSLKLKCGQYKIDFIEIDTNQDFNKVLLPFLAKRNKM
jgi:uncharacterized protein (DUF58 family)